MPGNVVQTVLKWFVDDASVKKAVASSQQVATANKTAASTVNDVFAKAFAQGKSSSDVLSAALGRQVRTVEDMTEAYAALDKQTNSTAGSTDTATVNVKKLADAFASVKEEATGAASAASNVAASSGTDTFGLPTAQGIRTTGLGRVGNILQFAGRAGIPGAREASGALELGGAATAVGADLAAVALGFTAVGAVALVASAAFNAATDSIAKNTERVKTFADALDTAFGAGTTKAIEALKAEAEQRRENARLTFNDLAAKSNAAPTILDQAATNFQVDLYNVQAAILGVSQITYDTRPTVESYSKSLDEQKKIMDDADLAIVGYNTALGNTKTVAADTANAIQTISDAQLSAAQFAASATSDSLKKRQADTQLEVQYLQAESDVLGAQHTAEADAIKKEVDARILLLGIQQQAIDLFKDEIAAREHDNAVLNTAEANSKSASDYLTKYVHDSQAANDAIAKLDLDHADKLNQIAQDAADKRTQIAADEADKERQAGIDRNEKLTDANKRASDDLIKLAEDTADKRAKIERDYARSAAEAIQDRDAVALDRAMTKRDDDLKDLTDSQKKQKKAIEKGLKDQQDTIEAAYQKQLTTARDAAVKALNLAAQAEARALGIENDKYTKEITLRQRALDIMVAQYQAFIARISGAGNQGGNGAPPNVATGVTYTQLNGDAFATWAHNNGIPGYAAGGMVQRTGLIFAHKRELVLTEQQQRNMGGAGITINGYGMNEEQVVRRVRKALREYNRGLKAAS